MRMKIAIASLVALAANSVLAQEETQSRFERRPAIDPGGQELDTGDRPIAGVSQLPPLPELGSATWRNWLVLVSYPRFSNFKHHILIVIILNTNPKKANVKVECYDQSGNAYWYKTIVIKPRGIGSFGRPYDPLGKFEFHNFSCRVVSDRPVALSARTHINEAFGRSVEWWLARPVIDVIPYPVE